MWHQIVSAMLSCFGFYSLKRSKRTDDFRKGTTERDSPLSMSVPSASVPHAHDSPDPDTLHKIFATNSSPRGYNAVRRPPVGQGSLDLGFQFGMGTGSPKKRRHDRLELFTCHVKQTLSEGRLGRNEEYSNDLASAPIPLLNNRLPSEPHVASQLSEKSLGLTELLASGYDSDARSMETSTIWDAGGTSKTGSKLVRKSLTTVEGSQSEPTAEVIQAQTSAPSTPLSLARSVSKSPCLVQIPGKFSLAEAMFIGANESPSDVPRRVSNDIANGDVTTPDTPLLRAMRMPNMERSESEWRLPTSAPQRVSSSNDGDLVSAHGLADTELSKLLGVLADRLELAKQESTTFEEARMLISELDPAPVDRLEKINPPYEHENDSDDNRPEGSPPMTAIKVIKKRQLDGIDAMETARVSITKASETTKPRSIHLFDMRISERLVGSLSPPASANLSKTTSELTINQPAGQSRVPSSAGRGPTFIAIEHNRRPSDPATKKIFETAKSRDVSAKVTEAKARVDPQLLDVSTIKPAPVVDKSSSYYGGMKEDTTSGDKIICIPVRSGSLKNTNSFAVGGRSASGPAPWQYTANQTERFQGVNSPGPPEPDEASNPSWVSLRDRSASGPKPSKFIKIDTTPTPVVRNLEQTSEANENMSEISVNDVVCGGKVLMGSESTQAAEDRKNENFSNSDIGSTKIEGMVLNSNGATANAWLNQDQATKGDPDFTETRGRTRPGTALDSRECKNISGSSLKEDQADELWHRAFKRLGELSDHGKLLATPQFDREGRRKRSAICTSEDSRLPQLTSSADARSRSADSSCSKSLWPLQAEKHRRRSAPIPTHENSGPRKKTSLVNRLQKSSHASLAGLSVNTTQSTKARKARYSEDSLGVWARFASHTRDQRNGPAGLADDVTIRDFSNEAHLSQPPSTPVSRRSSCSFDIRRLESWRLPTMKRPILRRRKTRSMPVVASSTERTRRQRKGMVARFRKLYRAKSAELHSLGSTQGHRSSISAGLSAEYHEHESTPTEGFLASSSPQHRVASDLGSADKERRDVSLDTISEVVSKGSKESRSIHSYTWPQKKRDAEEWCKVYQDCVSSLSAFQDDLDGDVDGLNLPKEERRVLSLSSVLRESTTNFQTELVKDTNRVKERLLKQLENSEDHERRLPMPGAFV